MRNAVKKQTPTGPAAPNKRSTTNRKNKKRNTAPVRSGTKQSVAVEMLRSPAGSTIAALTKATGWQPHSVRGFLAGVVRKRLKLNLQSAVSEGVRVYRITGNDSANTATTKSGRS